MKMFGLALTLLSLLGASPVASNDEVLNQLKTRGVSFSPSGFEESILKNDAQTIELFLKGDIVQDPSAINKGLLAAAQKDNVDLISKLLDAAAKRYPKKHYGGEALKWALTHKSPDVVQTLFDHKADVNIKVKGKTLLTMAVLLRSKKITEKVRKKLEGKQIRLMEIFGDPELIEKLIQRGANLDAKSSDGSAPLHLAAVKGDVSAAEVLLKHGASVDLPATDDITPLMLAVQKDDAKMVKILLKHGADVKAENGFGDSVVTYASPQSKEILALLKSTKK